MGRKYWGPRKEKMMDTHHIHYQIPLLEAARGLACARLIQLEFESMVLNSTELNDNDEQKWVTAYGTEN
jgi:hypothetical protein